MDILKLNNENSNVCTLCGSHRVEEADKINNHCLDCGDIIPKYKLFISKRLDKIEFDFDKGNFYINNNEAKQLIEFLTKQVEKPKKQIANDDFFARITKNAGQRD